MRNLIVTVLTLFIITTSFSQERKDKNWAYNNALEAIKIMDKGEIEKAISMLEESLNIDTKNYLYPYEIGYAHYLNKDYEKAIKILKKVIKFKKVKEDSFILLAGTLDVSGQPDEAIKIYDKGIKKFPNSGKLYFEKAIALEALEKYEEALNHWEKGIKLTPSYPSNYHAASIYYCKYTTEKLWGILYGELFLNMERGSKRTEEISKLIYDTYKSSIIMDSESEGKVSFSKNNEIVIPKNMNKFKFPFAMPYEMTMALAITSEMGNNNMGIASFHNIRKEFINHWYDAKRHKEYPNIIYDWHKKLIDKDYFESYNYWMLMKGNEEEFDIWYENNSQEFDDFLEWFSKNPLVIDNKNNFHRTQYN